MSLQNKNTQDNVQKNEAKTAQQVAPEVVSSDTIVQRSLLGRSLSTNNIIQLHKTIGNQAVGRLVQRSTSNNVVQKNQEETEGSTPELIRQTGKRMDVSQDDRTDLAPRRERSMAVDLTPKKGG